MDVRVAPQLGRRHDELADLGREFDHMAERIAALISAQKRLLADISHELRSPLARLTVALELRSATLTLPPNRRRLYVPAAADACTNTQNLFYALASISSQPAL